MNVGEKQATAPATCRVLVCDGFHNAFPTICRWNGAYWIAYRQGREHGKGPADVIVLRSPDGENWQQVSRVRQLFDNRDPHLTVFRGAMMLYFVARDERGVLHPLATRLDENGQPGAVTQIYDDHFIPWRPVVYGDRLYDAVYTGGNENQRSLHLIGSDDGLSWRRISVMGSPPGYWSETALHIDEQGVMSAYLRFKHSHSRPGAARGRVWRAEPPYDKWENLTTLPFRIEGPAVVEIRGVRYLITRGFNALGSCNALNIYVLAGRGDEPAPHSSIPCMRDAAYGHAVECDGKMLVVFYCTAPDGVNLYLARLPLAGGL